MYGVPDPDVGLVIGVAGCQQAVLIVFQLVDMVGGIDRFHGEGSALVAGRSTNDQLVATKILRIHLSEAMRYLCDLLICGIGYPIDGFQFVLVAIDSDGTGEALLPDDHFAVTGDADRALESVERALPDFPVNDFALVELPGGVDVVGSAVDVGHRSGAGRHG